MKRKLLVYNIMEFPAKIRFFNDSIADQVKDTGVETVYYDFNPETPPHDAQSFTHLIISGSESSALADSPWNKPLTQLIKFFIEADKNILGICYGHQFLVRVLCSKKHVYTLPVPEYGYSKIRFTPNPIFQGINDPVVLELHNDAVKNLPEHFEVIAENDKCIQAFQLKGKKVFGLQFHPEFDQDAAQHFLKETRNANPEFPNFYRNDLKNHSQLKQNRLFIQNFINL